MNIEYDQIQMSTGIIILGFIFISVENYLDTKAILCHTGASFSAYAKYER